MQFKIKESWVKVGSNPLPFDASASSKLDKHVWTKIPPAAWMLRNFLLICEPLKTSGPPQWRSNIPLAAPSSWKKNATMTSPALTGRVCFSKVSRLTSLTLTSSVFPAGQALSQFTPSLVRGAQGVVCYSLPPTPPSLPNNISVWLSVSGLVSWGAAVSHWLVMAFWNSPGDSSGPAPSPLAHRCQVADLLDRQLGEADVSKSHRLIAQHLILSDFLAKTGLFLS